MECTIEQALGVGLQALGKARFWPCLFHLLPFSSSLGRHERGYLVTILLDWYVAEKRLMKLPPGSSSLQSPRTPFLRRYLPQFGGQTARNEVVLDLGH